MKLKSFLIFISLLIIYTPSWAAGPADVLVIINDNSAASKEIGAYYVSKRKIPARNVVHIKCPDGETIPYDQYLSMIENPVKAHLTQMGAKNSIDYLVLTKGVPIRSGNNQSVDGMLMCMNSGLKPDEIKKGFPSPYYGNRDDFSHNRYGLYLATRLDGYTVAQAKALVDRSLAAKPEKGTFLIDTAVNRNSDGYRWMNVSMRTASENISSKGFKAILDDTVDFIGGHTDLMGYFSWGSNDSKFDVEKYKSNRYKPGAIADTAVSTSGRTFNRTTGGQSLSADLIESGITGVKGYVSEPYLDAIADPEILFDRYISGYNLADSFYMASRKMYWKDIVIGDPLCAPYAKQRSQSGFEGFRARYGVISVTTAIAITVVCASLKLRAGLKARC